MDIFPTKILYGETDKSDKGFGTVLINDFGVMDASFTEHDSMEKALQDAKRRQEMYRELFSKTINITNDKQRVWQYLFTKS